MCAAQTSGPIAQGVQGFAAAAFQCRPDGGGSTTACGQERLHRGRPSGHRPQVSRGQWPLFGTAAGRRRGTAAGATAPNPRTRSGAAVRYAVSSRGALWQRQCNLMSMCNAFPCLQAASFVLPRYCCDHARADTHRASGVGTDGRNVLCTCSGSQRSGSTTTFAAAAALRSSSGRAWGAAKPPQDTQPLEEEDGWTAVRREPSAVVSGHSVTAGNPVEQG